MTAANLRLVLASASPRRLELLRLAGLDPVVRPPDIDEAPRAGETPAGSVERLARDKAAAVGRSDAEVVLAADTAVVLDGVMLGKPDGPDHAAAMLRELSGRAHTVCTGVAVIDECGRVASRVVTTEVVFGPLTERDIARYVATGEPLDKAGGYGIQARGAALVARIDGSWTNVVGLPLVETRALLRAAGLDA